MPRASGSDEQYSVSGAPRHGSMPDSRENVCVSPITSATGSLPTISRPGTGAVVALGTGLIGNSAPEPWRPSRSMETMFMWVATSPMGGCMPRDRGMNGTSLVRAGQAGLYFDTLGTTGSGFVLQSWAMTFRRWQFHFRRRQTIHVHCAVERSA